MINSEELVFDDNMELYFTFEVTGEEVCLIISDGLYAYDEVLSTTYKQEIARFINNRSEWNEKVLKSIQERFMKVYNINSKAADFALVNIFVLFEQNEKPIFGLQFNTDLDREHGVGLKIAGKSYNVIEVGSADVAFC
jgi:serine/threonine protein phosphatase PrpC